MSSFELDDLESSASVVLGTWPDSSLAYYNPAYRQFARDNGAGADFPRRWGLGARVLDAIADPLRAFYSAAFAEVTTHGRMWQHDYLCPTADKQQRFRVRLYPVSGDRGVLAVHTLSWTGVHEVTDGGSYRRSDGLILQCASCRHVRRTDQPNRWDFVADFVRTPPPETSHGLCSTCAAEYQ